jgi:hypothetical protein
MTPIFFVSSIIVAIAAPAPPFATVAALPIKQGLYARADLGCASGGDPQKSSKRLVFTGRAFALGDRTFVVQEIEARVRHIGDAKTSPYDLKDKGKPYREYLVTVQAAHPGGLAPAGDQPVWMFHPTQQKGKATAFFLQGPGVEGNWDYCGATAAEAESDRYNPEGDL